MSGISRTRVVEHPAELSSVFTVEQLVDGEWVQLSGHYPTPEAAQTWIDQQSAKQSTPRGLADARVVVELAAADKACAQAQAARVAGVPQ